MDTVNHKLYGVLGVAKDASADDIRRAYKKLAMEYPPDKNKGCRCRRKVQGDKHHHRNISLFNRQYPNHYRVFARDILRKYIYIVNVVVIYIILYSL